VNHFGHPILLSSCTKDRDEVWKQRLLQRCYVYCLYANIRPVLDVAAFERLLGPCMDVMKRNVVAYEQQIVEIFGSELHDDDEQTA